MRMDPDGRLHIRQTGQNTIYTPVRIWLGFSPDGRVRTRHGWVWLGTVRYAMAFGEAVGVMAFGADGYNGFAHASRFI